MDASGSFAYSIQVWYRSIRFCPFCTTGFMYRLIMDLGKYGRSARTLAKIVETNFDKYFPEPHNCGPVLTNGDRCSVGFGGPFGGPLRVTLGRSGWLFQAGRGHPDAPGHIYFNFSKSGGHAYLTITGWVPAISVAYNIFNGDGYSYAYAAYYGLWRSMGLRIAAAIGG